MFGPVSGAHFNPVVSLADWFLGRRAHAGLSLTGVGAYTVAQCLGGIGGAVLANVMFDVGAWDVVIPYTMTEANTHHPNVKATH